MKASYRNHHIVVSQGDNGMYYGMILGSVNNHKPVKPFDICIKSFSFESCIDYIIGFIDTFYKL